MSTVDASRDQRWSAEGYARHAGFVAALGAPVVELLAPQPGERVLDLGCGDGALSLRLKEAGAEVLGLDASAELLAAARGRGLDVVEGDGHDLRFEAEFDAVFSNAALHWMPEAEKVAAGVFRALRPGGRFVGEFGGFANIAAIMTALRAALLAEGFDGLAVRPWYYPTAEEYAALLGGVGFDVPYSALIPRPTPLPTGIEGWLETFADPCLKDVPAALRPAVLERTVALLEPALRDGGGRWVADYVRLRFKAVKPG